jgi:hypothetical protein
MFSLDTLSVTTLKAEARALRQERDAAGISIAHAAALEEVAHRHGYRDWNTARAALPERITPPVQVGSRVSGAYLKQPFAGKVLGLAVLPDMQHFTVTVLFDEKVNVTPKMSFPHFRQRVTATVDTRGISPATREPTWTGGATRSGSAARAVFQSR